jgi:hypothetical protein
MKSDVANADAAMAGELGPLARQKASTVIHDGEQILRCGANGQVSAKLAQLQAKLSELEQLASERIRTAGKKLVDQVSSHFLEHRIDDPFRRRQRSLGFETLLSRSLRITATLEETFRLPQSLLRSTSNSLLTSS